MSALARAVKRTASSSGLALAMFVIPLRCDEADDRIVRDLVQRRSWPFG
jgi:hypothetical protein